ncbi:STAS domain-containing protein [Mycolicibacterium smegmatis]|jgi:anti-anti-sigma factor|uniref:Anti-sigma factor antagonist n=3 Tax=Mycolicibacterium smegmatis TaxID=1772 RepID=A0R6G6_MYCS2|nr:STAS domain-containing protein [Mycolicibacterium smegmatis]ABK74572.1 anti-sigma factor antagonist [Mycolicibacterium smegmatis MC2 155]AFP42792.1 Anti-sigma factor antagonist [Mycolicibacterium smegmatis MC2 155]AIU11516.1 anti-sigma factor antagonist [Mycolicibacterium smegmatis MC2 155]AIU18141.1 anti-sigma factor antagonist [Mycolicibacterium smegmatis]AIU24763.1 anti-sigma factor antagonist [Mycolicibacterium smegmatis]
MNLSLNTAAENGSRSATVTVAGELDFMTTNKLVDYVSELLSTNQTLDDLRLDCADLTFCDSAGLSGLLNIHRQTSPAGIQLHIDRRPPHLERLLDITGILEYLTATPDTSDSASGE